MRGMKLKDPNYAFTYDVCVVFMNKVTWIEVDANTASQAAEIAERNGYILSAGVEPWHAQQQSWTVA